MSTIVTLALDGTSQAHFNALRAMYYPPHLNQIAAHVTLFHRLPDTGEIMEVLQGESQAMTGFVMRTSDMLSLGRGVAYKLESPDLKRLHQRLSATFTEHLSPQDRQGFRPHIVVQNKAAVEVAKALAAKLTAEFVPRQMEAEGLDWWDYQGGPWKLRQRFVFARADAR